MAFLAMVANMLDRLLTTLGVCAALFLGGNSLAAAEVCKGSFADGYAAVAPSVPRITALAVDPFTLSDRVRIRVGAGIVIDDASNIATNAHLIVGAAKIMIAVQDGQPREADVLGIDPVSDLAVLRPADGSLHLPKAPLGKSSTLRVGEELLAIGYPLGLELTATKGIVSGAHRIVPLAALSWLTPMIQIDAALNPGNSGGPVVNICGEVVGMSTLAHQEAQNVNFAIPIDAVREIAAQLLERGHVVRPWHGINGQMVSPFLRMVIGVPPGFMVETIEPGSPAERVGLRGGTLPIMIGPREYLIGGDIIGVVNGEELENLDQVAAIARSLKVGDQLTIEYWRDGEVKSVTVTLPERPILPGDIELLRR
jgi:S1-C subfamily serine protease